MDKYYIWATLLVCSCLLVLVFSIRATNEKKYLSKLEFYSSENQKLRHPEINQNDTENLLPSQETQIHVESQEKLQANDNNLQTTQASTEEYMPSYLKLDENIEEKLIEQITPWKPLNIDTHPPALTTLRTPPPNSKISRSQSVENHFFAKI